MMNKEYLNEKIDRINIVVDRTYTIVVIKSIISLWSAFWSFTD